jgi:hypothetical protein
VRRQSECAHSKHWRCRVRFTPARSPWRAHVTCVPRLRQRQSFSRTLSSQKPKTHTSATPISKLSHVFMRTYRILFEVVLFEYLSLCEMEAVFACGWPYYCPAQVEQVQVRDIAHLHQDLSRVEALGGEGLMLRLPGSKYVRCSLLDK